MIERQHEALKLRSWNVDLTPFPAPSSAGTIATTTAKYSSVVFSSGGRYFLTNPSKARGVTIYGLSFGAAAKATAVRVPHFCQKEKSIISYSVNVFVE